MGVRREVTLRRHRAGVRAIAIAALLAAAPSAAATRQVLVLHSYARGVEPHETIAAAYRSALTRESPEPVELHEISLETALFAGGDTEGPFVDYLRAFEAGGRLDLVVSFGGPAARFVQRNRAKIFTTTPVLVAGVDTRHLVPGSLTDRDALLPVRIDLAGAFENLFRLAPGTREVLVVLGSSPVERFWSDEIRKEFAPFGERARLTFVNDLPYRAMLDRAAKLPKEAAVFYGMYAIDAEGAPHSGDDALVAMRAATAAPIFGLYDAQLGEGIVGGPLISLAGIGREEARATIRLLHGEAPPTVRVAPIVAGPPRYDARELARFRIDPRSLPPGSTIAFREPSLWAKNKWAVAAVAGIALAEGLLIVVLLTALAGRRRAEASLRASREQYALAVEGANDGLWDWNVLTGEVYFSYRCKEMLGYEEGEAADRFDWWEERIHEDDREAALAALESHLDGTAPAFRAEHRLRHQDGSYRWVLARGKAQRDPAGTPYRMAGSLTDFTERKAAEDAVREVSRRLLVAQEEERARLARELHDDITQRLARLAIDAGRVEREMSEVAGGATIRGVREELAGLSEDVHALSYRLHPSILEDLGLPDALQVECDRFSSFASVPSTLLLRDVPDAIPRGVALCLYRVAQEALRNVHRHARARAVVVNLLGVDGGLQLAVRDDGVGFNGHGAPGRPSLGHASMRERVLLVAGELDIESAPGGGTTVLAWVPLNGGMS